MDYIQKLRQSIGHEPIIMVGACALIMDSANLLLMLHRTDNLAWGLPGGALEPGESLEQAAIRETYEEAGLQVTQLFLFDIFSGPGFFYEYPNGDQVYNVTAVYRVERFTGSLKINPAEHLEAAFFNPHQLPTPISQPVLPIIQKFVHSLRQT